MREILMLSPYDAMSHALWREGLRAFLTQESDNIIHEVVLPPRFFSWRFRGNSLSYARHPSLQRTFDVIIATSMTDISALRGLNRHLATTPCILYFHENQFDFPDQHQQGLVERQITSIYSALSADILFFNSAYNRDSFLHGANELLGKMPDEVPTGVIKDLERKALVVPIAVWGGLGRTIADGTKRGEAAWEASAAEPLRAQPLGKSSAAEPLRAEPLGGASAGKPLRVLWNHRWEYDKGPDVLLGIVQALIARDFPFTLSLLGQRFKKKPPQFVEILEVLRAAGKLGLTEFIEDRGAYFSALAEHDVVLSTTRHEFQGLAIQEAMLHGCIPVVPDALCYPEYVPTPLRYSNPDHAVDILLNLDEIQRTPGIDLSLTNYDWRIIGPHWLSALDELAPNQPDV